MALDPQSPSILQFKKDIEVLIETKRDALERPAKDATETAVLRGYIKALRDQLKKLTGDHYDDDQDTS